MGNLIINWPGSGNWNQNWPSLPSLVRLTAGDFTIQSVGEFRFSQSNGSYLDVYVSGNLNMNSTGAGNDILNLAEGNNSVGFLNVYGNITHLNGTITASGTKQQFRIGNKFYW